MKKGKKEEKREGRREGIKVKGGLLLIEYCETTGKCRGRDKELENRNFSAKD